MLQSESPLIPPQPEVRPWSPPRDINAVEDILDEPSPVTSPSANLVDLVAQTETISLSDHTLDSEPEVQTVIDQENQATHEAPVELDATSARVSAKMVAASTPTPADGVDSDDVDQDSVSRIDAVQETSVDVTAGSQDDLIREDTHNASAGVTASIDMDATLEAELVADVEMTFEESTDSLFFVDTDPIADAADHPAIVYETFAGAPLGEPAFRAPTPEEEEIVFKRRSYAQPEPIALNVASVPIEGSSASAENSAPAPALPTSLNRRQKKALKKEKRTRNKSKGKKAAKTQKNRRRPQAYEGSDLDWGSDGPPARMLDMEGAGLDSDDSDIDEDVLRDYLAGTLLGGQKASGKGEENEEEDSDEDDSDMEEDITRAYDDAAVGGDEQFELDSDEAENPDVEAESGDDSEDSEDEDDDDSSDLGEIHFTATRMEPEEDSDEDSDDDDMFNAKDSWNETEWFIRNMEVSTRHPAPLHCSLLRRLSTAQTSAWATAKPVTSFSRLSRRGTSGMTGV